MEIIEKHYINDFYDLKDLCWSGAIDTLNDIENANLETEFMDLLKDYFIDSETIEDTEINDFIWFERDTIYSDLGLNENGRLEEEEEEE